MTCFDAETEGRTFAGLVCSGGQIHSLEFNECVFRRCAFVETAFTFCRFTDCLFDDCDLSVISVKEVTFTHVRFENSKLLGVNWSLASWDKGGFLEPLAFANCDVSYSTFFGLKLHGLKLTGCIAHDADFAEADLTRGHFNQTDFSESRFLHTNLTEVDFTGASNYTINAAVNILKKTRFSLPEAMTLLYSLDIVLADS